MKNNKKLLTTFTYILGSFVLAGCSNNTPQDISETIISDQIESFILVSSEVPEIIDDNDAASETSTINENNSTESSEIIIEETESSELKDSSDEKKEVSSENNSISDNTSEKKEPENNNSETITETTPEPSKPEITVSNGKSIHLDDSFKSIDPSNCFSDPKESDFGEHYNKAVAVYNAIINKQETVEIVFDVEGTSDSISGASTEVCGEVQRLWESFESTFNNKVLNNTVALETFQASYYSGKIIVWTEKIYPYLEKNLTYSDIFYEANVNAGLYNGMSEKEAVKTINNWICRKISYSESNPDAATALQTGVGNCAVYAALFEGMCNNAGIQNRYHAGYANNGSITGPHAWNSVCLNETWYYVDVCWNDSTNNKYLLISEEQINKDHNV